MNAGALSLFQNIADLNGIQEMQSLANYPVSNCFSNHESYIHFDNILQVFSQKDGFSHYQNETRTGAKLYHKQGHSEFVISRDNKHDGFPCDFEVRQIKTIGCSYFSLQIKEASRTRICAPITVDAGESSDLLDKKQSYAAARSVG